jgi:hypothetical protein
VASIAGKPMKLRQGPSVTERDREEERGSEAELGFGGGVGLLIGLGGRWR